MISSPLPSSNTSLTYTTPNSPPHLTHAPLLAPSPTQLLINVHAAAINPVDIQLWGNAMIGWLAGKKEKGFGRDYSGEIVAVGEELKGKGWEVGDKVFGLYSHPTEDGTFSQYIRITPTADPIARKPSCWTYEEAASVPLVVLTAFAMLDWLPAASASPNGEKRRVIVSGASGGVGMWVVQLAKRLYNCHVIGVCSSKNAAFVTSLGADEVIDYTSQDVKTSLLNRRPNNGKNKYDLYADCVGGYEVFEYWTDLLHPTAAYITIVGDKTSRTAMGGPLTYLTYPSQVLRFLRGYFLGPRYANVIFYTKDELLDQAAELAERGEVRTVMQEVVEGILDEGGYREAWEKVRGHMEGGRVRGKIVVRI